MLVCTCVHVACVWVNHRRADMSYHSAPVLRVGSGETPDTSPDLVCRPNSGNSSAATLPSVTCVEGSLRPTLPPMGPRGSWTSHLHPSFVTRSQRGGHYPYLRTLSIYTILYISSSKPRPYSHLHRTKRTARGTPPRGPSPRDS